MADRVVVVVPREQACVSLSLLLRILALDVQQDFLVLKDLSLKVLNRVVVLGSFAALFASKLLLWDIH